MPSVKAAYRIKYLHTPQRKMGPRGGGDIPTLIFVSALDVYKWSASRPGRFTPLVKSPRCLLKEGWVSLCRREHYLAPSENRTTIPRLPSTQLSAPYILDGNKPACLSHIIPITRRCSYLPAPVCPSINMSDASFFKQRTIHQITFSGFHKTSLKTTHYTATKTSQRTHSRPNLSIGVSHGSLYLNGRINCKDARWPFENTPEHINMTKG